MGSHKTLLVWVRVGGRNAGNPYLGTYIYIFIFIWTYIHIHKTSGEISKTHIWGL